MTPDTFVLIAVWLSGCVCGWGIRWAWTVLHHECHDPKHKV